MVKFILISILVHCILHGMGFKIKREVVTKQICTWNKIERRRITCSWQRRKQRLGGHGDAAAWINLLCRGDEDYRCLQFIYSFEG